MTLNTLLQLGMGAVTCGQITRCAFEPDPEQAARNAAKLAAVKASMGEKYLLHPSNRVKKGHVHVFAG